MVTNTACAAAKTSAVYFAPQSDSQKGNLGFREVNGFDTQILCFPISARATLLIYR